MKLRVGDMWSVWREAGLFLITANATLVNGRLVMGAGIAKEAATRWPTLPARLGADLGGWLPKNGEYNLLISFDWPDAKLGLFQTKVNWQQPSSVGLIGRSVEALCWWASHHPDTAIHLNYPGIGNGGLTPAQVEPLIKILPDNVHVWTRR